MKKVLVAGFYGLCSGLLGSVILYALLCVVLTLVEPGIQGRPALALRNSILVLIGLFLLWALGRTVSSYGRRVKWGGAVLAATCSAFFLLYGYATFYERHTRDQDWQRLRLAAATLKASRGVHLSDLRLPRSLYTVVHRRNQGVDELYVTPSDPWVGAAFGIDLMQFDAIVVTLGPDGTLQDVRISYF